MLLISESTKKWNTGLNAGQTRLVSEIIKRGIFQGDSFINTSFCHNYDPFDNAAGKHKYLHEVEKKSERIRTRSLNVAQV